MEDENKPVVVITPEEIKKAVEDYFKDVVCVIIPRHDTSSNWVLNDTILSDGEYGVEDDTHRVKRGNGTDKWSDLDYETFGIEHLMTAKAEDVSYNNTTSGISKVNVQECLDYIIDSQLQLKQILSAQESVKNKVYTIDANKISSSSYPSARAVIEYVNNITSEYEDRITKLENKLK